MFSSRPCSTFPSFLLKVVAFSLVLDWLLRFQNQNLYTFPGSQQLCIFKTGLTHKFCTSGKNFTKPLKTVLTFHRGGREETAGAICISGHGNYKCKMAHPLWKEWERERRRAKQQTQLCLVIGLSRSRRVRRNFSLHVAFFIAMFTMCHRHI